MSLGVTLVSFITIMSACFVMYIGAKQVFRFSKLHNDLTNEKKQL